MDENLANELENILKMENVELQEKSMTKIMFYLLTLPTLDNAYRPLLERFITRAFEILPSSTLPQQLSKKFSILNPRKKRVSFSSFTVLNLNPIDKMSREGKDQQLREHSSLSINNTDPLKKFSPRPCFIEGLEFKTKIIPLIPVNLGNCIKPELAFSEVKFTKLKLDLEQILNDPLCLESLI